jgi:hypothetical protein
MLTDLATVKSWLGLTTPDPARDLLISSLIAGVDEQVKRYCGRQFEQANVILKQLLDQTRELVLDETPVNHVFYCGLGSTEVLLLTNTGTNAQASFRVDAGVGKLTLVSGMVAVDIAVPITMTMDQLATQINLEAGWAATAATSYEDYPANALLDQSAETEEAGTPFALRGALSTRRLVRGEAEGIYEFNGNSIDEYFDHYPSRSLTCTAPMVVIYNGGYQTTPVNLLPAGLVLLVNKICCDAWRNFPNSAAMKSEAVGDYSYTKFDQAQIASAIGPYMSALDLYKRV